MTSQFSPKVSEILAYSREEAARLASQSVAPEHLLLGLLRMKEGPVMNVFQRLGIDLQHLKTELEDRVRQDEIGMPIFTQQLVLNEKASNILKLAVLEARIQHTTRVEEQHLLLAILHDQTDTGAKQVLEHRSARRRLRRGRAQQCLSLRQQSVCQHHADHNPAEDQVEDPCVGQFRY